MWRLALLFYIVLTGVALADIGEVGSPVVPSNAEDAAPASEPASSASHPTLVMVIHLTPRIPDYVEPLKRLLASIEPGTEFEVVTYIPSGGSPKFNARVAQQANDRLGGVVQTMRDFGVDVEKIHTYKIVAVKPNPEIRIFTLD